MKIENISAPNTLDINFLTNKINEETKEFGSLYPFAFFIKNELDEIIAGCNGSVVFGAIYIAQLWVHSTHRKAGLGYKLMERVHKLGREIGCKMATISTMNFQSAIGFYEKLGYVVDFERSGYTKNSSCIFLSMKLLA